MADDDRKVGLPGAAPEKSSNVSVYNLHSPFTPPDSSPSTNAGSLSSGLDGNGKKKFVSYDTSLGTTAGMTTCTSCQQQVMTNVSYKPGTYAWLMCLLFICCGLILCCCLIPFFMKRFKDVYHTCPRCNRVLHVEKRKCCQ
ncbi:lipopolysaccharide-induced tumor necrosis factor-alpha factor homolog [Brachionichthys hirsutus]|uniref:lipopolysaccharide-induced tumor necrosis factor-alpha factor homolog n=1 Tax=Brachionichthys hirsutus TaxID=412623 RepID=UPI0036045419